MKGSNCFWGIGYVGVKKEVPFYSSRTNARRAVALQVIVDYFAFAYDGLVSNQKTAATDKEDERYWPYRLMNKTSPTLENCVVLYEDGEYKINNGKEIQDDHLFCILVRHKARYTLLIPQSHDFQPWREIDFLASNWSRKVGNVEKKRKIDYVGLTKDRYR